MGDSFVTPLVPWGSIFYFLSFVFVFVFIFHFSHFLIFPISLFSFIDLF